MNKTLNIIKVCDNSFFTIFIADKRLLVSNKTLNSALIYAHDSEFMTLGDRFNLFAGLLRIKYGI